MVAISPQTPGNSLTTAEKKGPTSPVLSDKGNGVARQFELVYAFSEEVRPLLTTCGSALPTFNGDESWEAPASAAYVIGQGGKIAFAGVEANWTKRTEPAKILEVLHAVVRR